MARAEWFREREIVAELCNFRLYRGPGNQWVARRELVNRRASERQAPISQRLWRKLADNPMTKIFLHCAPLYAVFLKAVFSPSTFPPPLYYCILVPSFHLSTWITTFVLMTFPQLFYSIYRIPMIMILPLVTYKMHLMNEHISSWMTIKLLTLNSSRMEYVVIGNRHQQFIPWWWS